MNFKQLIEAEIEDDILNKKWSKEDFEEDDKEIEELTKDKNKNKFKNRINEKSNSAIDKEISRLKYTFKKMNFNDNNDPQLERKLKDNKKQLIKLSQDILDLSESIYISNYYEIKIPERELTILNNFIKKEAFGELTDGDFIGVYKTLDRIIKFIFIKERKKTTPEINFNSIKKTKEEGIDEYNFYSSLNLNKPENVIKLKQKATEILSLYKEEDEEIKNTLKNGIPKDADSKKRKTYSELFTAVQSIKHGISYDDLLKKTESPDIKIIRNFIALNNTGALTKNDLENTRKAITNILKKGINRLDDFTKVVINSNKISNFSKKQQGDLIDISNLNSKIKKDIQQTSNNSNEVLEKIIRKNNTEKIHTKDGQELPILPKSGPIRDKVNSGDFKYLGSMTTTSKKAKMEIDGKIYLSAWNVWQGLPDDIKNKARENAKK